jgi:hypothetical protein
LIDWGEVRRRGPRRVPEEWLRSDPTDEVWWETHGRGTFKNTAEYIEAGKRLDYYNAVRDGIVRAQYDKQGRLLVPGEQKPELESQAKSGSKPQPEPEDEPGPQEARAIASLIKVCPDGIPDDMKSVEQLRGKALRYLPPDPKTKGPPQWDAYDAAIKRLRHSGFRKPEK